MTDQREFRSDRLPGGRHPGDSKPLRDFSFFWSQKELIWFFGKSKNDDACGYAYFAP